MATGVQLGWNYGLLLLLAVPVAGLFVRLFIFQHDCGHGSFFANRRLNDAVGRVMALQRDGAIVAGHRAAPLA